MMHMSFYCAARGNGRGERGWGREPRLRSRGVVVQQLRHAHDHDLAAGHARRDGVQRVRAVLQAARRAAAHRHAARHHTHAPPPSATRLQT